MTNKIVALWILLALLSRSVLGQCGCPEEKGELVFSYEFDQGHKLIICGFANRVYGSAEVESYSDITVMSCRDNRILLSIDGAMLALSVNRFRFRVRDGDVIIQQLIRLPSEPGWQWAPRPLFEKKVSCIDGRFTISEWKKVFVVPPKTQVEIDGFLDVYLNHFEKIGDHEELPYKLIVCALNGSARAEQLLMSFPEDHPEIYEGATAEVYGEMVELYRDILKK